MIGREARNANIVMLEACAAALGLTFLRSRDRIAFDVILSPRDLFSSAINSWTSMGFIYIALNVARQITKGHKASIIANETILNLNSSLSSAQPRTSPSFISFRSSLNLLLPNLILAADARKIFTN